MDWGRSSTLSMPTWCSPTREKGVFPSSSLRVRVVGGVEVFPEVVLPGAWKGGGEYAPASSLSGPRVRLSGGFGRLSAARASSFSFPRCALRGCLVVLGLEPSTDLPPAGCLRETETELLPAGCPAEMSIDLLPAGSADECPPLLPNYLPPWSFLERVGRAGEWWSVNVAAGTRGPAGSRGKVVGSRVGITGTGEWSSFLLWCSVAEMISLRQRTLSLCGTCG